MDHLDETIGGDLDEESPASLTYASETAFRIPPVLECREAKLPRLPATPRKPSPERPPRRRGRLSGHRTLSPTPKACSRTLRGCATSKLAWQRKWESAASVCKTAR